jgi:hypothetical protein
MYKTVYYGNLVIMTNRSIDEIIQDIEEQIMLNQNLLNRIKN